MTDALNLDQKPAPASDAPDVIHLSYVPPPPKKKQPKRKRQHVKHTRYNDDELAEFELRARAAGLSDGAYTRVATVGDAGPRAKRAQPTAASHQRAQLITAINRAGNLVNQGIYALNRIDAAQWLSGDHLAEEVAAARELLDSAIPALIEALYAAAGDVREG